MRKIFVLGNGFDLNLGLKTSYFHFMKSDEFNEFHSRTQRDDYYYSLAKHLKSLHENSKWVDIEVEIAKYSLQHADSNFINDYKLLCGSLKKYLEIQQKAPLIETSKAYELFTNNYNEEDEFSVISFNYTNTAERILSQYFHKIYGSRFKPYSIEYVHGSLKSENIIFGVDDSHKISPGHIEIRKTTFPNFSGNVIKGALEKYADEIHFFGLSFGETDHMYFKEYFMDRLCKSSSVKKHFFYHYGNEGWNSLHEQFYVLTNGETHKFKIFSSPEFVNVI